MTQRQFIEIIETANQETIKKRLKESGYVFCNQDSKLGKVGIVELVQAVEFETEDFIDKGHKRLFNGRICGIVKGYENYEFLYVNVYDIKPSADPFDKEETAIQIAMLIWAKEIAKQ